MILLRHCLTRFKGSCRCLEFLIPVGRHLSLEYILSLKLCFPFFFSQANANYFTWSKTGARSSTKTLSVVNGTFQERIACFWNLIIDNFMSEKWRVVYSSNFYVGGGFSGQTCIHQELWTYSGCYYETMCLSIIMSSRFLSRDKGKVRWTVTHSYHAHILIPIIPVVFNVNVSFFQNSMSKQCQCWII